MPPIKAQNEKEKLLEQARETKNKAAIPIKKHENRKKRENKTRNSK